MEEHIQNFSMHLFIYVTFGVMGFILYKSVSRDKPFFNAIFGLPFAAYYVNRYFTSEMGKRYKIPLSKLQSIESYGNDGLKINFLNAANKADFEIIEKVEEKGLEIVFNLGLLKPAS
jgi:hypothetical protein